MNSEIKTRIGLSALSILIGAAIEAQLETSFPNDPRREPASVTQTSIGGTNYLHIVDGLDKRYDFYQIPESNTWQKIKN